MSEFDNISGFGKETTEETAKAPEAKSNNALKEVYAAVANKIEHDADYAARRNSRVNDIIVTKVFGFGSTGSLQDMTDEVLDKAVQAGDVTVLPADSTESGVVAEKDGKITGTVKVATSGKHPYERPYIEGQARTKADGKPNVFRKVVNRPENVGYEIKNVSDKALDYKTEVYAQDETGKYVATAVQKSLAPGETAQITRTFLTVMTLAEEFNFTLGNGAVIVKPGKKESATDNLQKGYFQFRKDSGMDVNSPEVKIIISEEVNVNGVTKNVVKPEFVECFGFLNNEKEKAAKKERTAKAPTVKPTTAEVTAAYLRAQLGM